MTLALHQDMSSKAGMPKSKIGNGSRDEEAAQSSHKEHHGMAGQHVDLQLIFMATTTNDMHGSRICRNRMIFD